MRQLQEAVAAAFKHATTNGDTFGAAEAMVQHATHEKQDALACQGGDGVLTWYCHMQSLQVGGEAHGILLWPLGGLAFIGHDKGPKGDPHGSTVALAGLLAAARI
jgi:hypothetical protein